MEAPCKDSAWCSRSSKNSSRPCILFLAATSSLWGSGCTQARPSDIEEMADSNAMFRLFNSVCAIFGEGFRNSWLEVQRTNCNVTSAQHDTSYMYAISISHSPYLEITQADGPHIIISDNGYHICITQSLVPKGEVPSTSQDRLTLTYRRTKIAVETAPRHVVPH